MAGISNNENAMVVVDIYLLFDLTHCKLEVETKESAMAVSYNLA